MDPVDASHFSARLSFLRDTNLFLGVPEPVLREVVPALRTITADAGETVFERGDPGDAVYLIEQGRLQLRSGNVVLLTRGRGECVGEFALVDNGPRSASGIADCPVRMLRWQRADFERVLEKHPEVARGIFRILTGKLREGVDRFVDSAAERERWRQDLERAREIQTGMLPTADWQAQGLQLSGLSRPANVVGGDYFDYFALSDRCAAVIICDVTGHGFYSGLFVAMAKSCLHTQIGHDSSPVGVMRALRSTLDLSIGRSLLMSCCYVVFDTVARELRFANAGHPPAYHLSGDTGALTPLAALDPILGALEPGESGYQASTQTWAAGDLLVLYSDAVIEALDTAGEQFGLARLETCIREGRGDSAVGMRQRVIDAVYRFSSQPTLADDLTVVVARAD